MKRVYTYLKTFSNSRFAFWVLALLCTAESCISPITPLILLVPMLLLQPQKRIRMVCWATAFGVLGSILGYGIGYYFIQWAMPHMDQWGYLDVFLKVKSWFATWGLWLLLPASVLPFPPFKILTITAGASGVHFLSFLGVTFIVRWVHFFLLPLLPVLGQWVWKEYRREEGPSMSI